MQVRSCGVLEVSKYNKLDHKYVDHDFCITSYFYQEKKKKPLFFVILNNLKENMAFRTSHATWFLVFCVLNAIPDASGITLVLMLSY